MHLQAYKIGETPEISLPVMINMDGFILTHAFEGVDVISQEEADSFLPPFKPAVHLDVKNPVTMGVLAEPQWYMEARCRMQEALYESRPVIKQAARDFKGKFGRWYGDVIDTYRIDGAETVFVAMGSLIGTLKDAVDDLRDKGEKVGLLKIRCFRPFPGQEIAEALKNTRRVAIMEKAFSLGASGILGDEIKAALYATPYRPEISTFFIGLGGRDIPKSSIVNVYNQVKAKQQNNVFVDLKTELVK